MSATLTAYLRERFRPAIFGPVVALHVAFALWASRSDPTLGIVVQSLGLAVLLLLQFRLWDDLEDRSRDRVAHPARVLVRASPAPFRRALAMLGLTNVFLVGVTGSSVALGGLVLLDLAFGLAYRVRPRLPDAVWRFNVLLLKYSAFVGILAAATGTTQPARLAAAAVVIYIGACAYEVLHNRRPTLGATS